MNTSAAVIDPRRDCDIYLEIADRNNLKIELIFETHRNEDYVVGSLELQNMTDAEIRAAAEYFGSMKWTPWMKVVESDMIPKTRPNNGMFITLEGNEKEPIGHRLIETPVDGEATEVLRNDHSGFIVYAPPGSVKKGETLVKTGGGRTIACGLCHGQDLRGLGPVPGLAGRSPSYMGRQLYDMQAGIRKGEWTELMKPVVAKLTDDDLIAITAYIASLNP